MRLTGAELERLYLELERPLYNIALRWTWNSAEAQELVQEAFVRVWERSRQVRVETAKAYIYRTVLNLAQNHARRRELWKRLRGWLGSDQVGEDQPGQVFDRELMKGAIQELPEAQRAVLLLCEFSGLKQHEIAAVLEIPAGTVASRRNSALRRLKEALK